ncbi:MAG TPA: hypothetical protein DCE44_09820 [Verrucomicrobiales bacterium]|nr:hypothetical protein [Verrucomicrobiales bacterium]
MAINLDRERIYIECPRCDFWARPFLRQIRHHEIIVCGGCKANIRLDDYLGTLRKAHSRANRALEELETQLQILTVNIKL